LIYQNIVINAASPRIGEISLDLHDRFSKIEAHDRHQDGEVALLKMNEEGKVVHDLTSQIVVLEDSKEILVRPKRPAQCAVYSTELVVILYMKYFESHVRI